MANRDINKGLLYSNKHFEVLLKLYKSTFKEENELDEIYHLVTEAVVEGLGIDRCSFWRFDNDKLHCIDLYDKKSGKHTIEEDLLVEHSPNYFQALRDGIAIVADDAMTNQYTQELRDNYLVPLGITDMLDLPLRNDGDLTSVLCCEHRDSKKKWSEGDLAFARSIGDILALMLEQHKRRVFEKTIIEQERKLSLITNNTNDSFVVFESSKLTYVSPSYLRFLQYTEEEAYNLTLEDILSHIHPADIQRVKDTILENLKKKVRNFKYEFRFKGKSGVYVWREDTASVLYDELGRYEKYILISRDITALKKAELKVQKLFSISTKLNEQLLDFTHIISHNIRSNSSNLTMLIDLINVTTDPGEKEYYFQLLKKSNDLLTETIDYLHEAVSIKQSKGLQKVVLNIKTVVDKILDKLSVIIESNSIEITTYIPEDYAVKVIPQYFESVIYNLLTNAIKYKSGERISKVHIGVQKKTNKYIFSVEDNGLGIDLKKNRAKLFGMYKTFHGNADALGIGLFMTKNHIEAMGGSIEVKSTVGVGSEFKFYLND